MLCRRFIDIALALAWHQRTDRGTPRQRTGAAVVRAQLFPFFTRSVRVISLRVQLIFCAGALLLRRMIDDGYRNLMRAPFSHLFETSEDRVIQIERTAHKWQ